MSTMSRTHSAGLFPEDDDSVIVSTLGKEITRAELHRKANRILGPMGHGPEKFEDFASLKEELKFQALGEILSEIFIYHNARELGIDVDALGDKALNEWAKDFESPEAKLAEIAESGITIDDMRRLLIKETVVEMLKGLITEEMKDATPEEKDAFFKSWLASGMAALEVEFADDELERMWAEYVAALTGSAGGAAGSALRAGEGQ
jgi:hypothetical protein